MTVWSHSLGDAGSLHLLRQYGLAAEVSADATWQRQKKIIMSVWKSHNGQKQNEVLRLRVSLAAVSRRRMRAGWDEQMLQLLLVSHINQEQMATGRRRGRETETERAVGRGTAWSGAWWRLMSLQTPGGEDSLLIQCETNVSKHRQVQNRDRGRDLHNHWDGLRWPFQL